jgi:hypothetical protein
MEERELHASVENAMNLFAENDGRNGIAAQSMLERLSHAQIIDQSLGILERNAELDVASRRFVYRALSSYALLASANGEDLDKLIGFLSKGLEDAELRATSITGLARMPESRRARVAELLVTDFENQGFPPDASLRGFLHNIVRWGEDAQRMQPIMPYLERIFHDTALEDTLRGMVAGAMIAIGPAERAISQFGPSDTKLVLGPIGAAGAMTNGTFGTDDQNIRARFRQLVLNGLGHTNPEVRTHAFEALAPAYGVDFLVADGQGGFHANPEFVEALETLAAKETDTELQSRAQSVLDSLDERVRNAIRRRIKRAQSAAPDGD